MKRTLLYLIALVLTIAAGAQTLKVTTTNGTYQYPASEMTEHSPALFSGGTTLTIGNDVFDISDITSIEVVRSQESGVEDNTVNIVYNGSTATVTMADNVMSYVTATVNGAHVTITQTNTDAVDGDEITYVLSGTTTDGGFELDGDYKCTIALDGLTLTNPSGAAINISNGKRIQISAKKNTVNTLTDGTGGSQTGCIYSKGQIQLQGYGTLNVTGKTKHAIKSGDYIAIKNLTLNITSAVKDGINCNEYFLMESGTVTISSAGDEGIQCELDGTSSTGETTDHEDEDSGNIYIEGGILTVNAAGEGIESKGELHITGGEVCVTAKDDAINAASHLTISGGKVYACSSGNDGIDANGNCYIKGGLVYAVGSREPEVAIDANTERNFKLYVEGGTIIAIGGLENGASLTQSCYSTNSWSKSTWYALTVGNDTFAFKTPSSGGNSLVVSGASQPTLMSGVTVSDGTSIFSGVGYTDASVSGGSSVSLSSYSGGNGGGGWPGGGGGWPGGGGWR
ncbi:MAG: carbohydrate-binding domain-containing protein [Prevotella sp.]|nr:carbohydrate-binding domain-containing protein [Prevotella sp.]